MTDLTLVPLELRRSGSGNDHTLDGVCVPYGRTTLKAGYPQGERFVPGAFAETVATRAKVRLTDSHDDSGKRPVGVAVSFREAEEGLLGTFRFYNTPEGRGAWENVVEETYGGLSVGFLPIAERRGEDGAREVTKARLFHVSLVDEPAYEDAKVLAVRHAVPDVSALLAVTWDLEGWPESPDMSTVVFGGSR